MKLFFEQSVGPRIRYFLLARARTRSHQRRRAGSDKAYVASQELPLFSDIRGLWCRCPFHKPLFFLRALQATIPSRLCGKFFQAGARLRVRLPPSHRGSFLSSNKNSFAHAQGILPRSHFVKAARGAWLRPSAKRRCSKATPLGWYAFTAPSESWANAARPSAAALLPNLPVGSFSMDVNGGGGAATLTFFWTTIDRQPAN
jgi:hypothetical protein